MTGQYFSRYLFLWPVRNSSGYGPSSHNLPVCSTNFHRPTHCRVSTHISLSPIEPDPIPPSQHITIFNINHHLYQSKTKPKTTKKQRPEKKRGKKKRRKKRTPTHNIPPNRKPHRRIDQELGMSHKTARDGQQRRRLSQGKLHTTHNPANGEVAQQRTQRTCELNGGSQTKEKAGSNGAGDGDEGDVALVQASCEVGFFGGGEEVGGGGEGCFLFLFFFYPCG